MNKKFFVLLVSICVCFMGLLQVKAQPNVELITDGSFEQFSASNPVFETDYTYKSNGGVLPGEYYVGSNSSGHGVSGSLGGGWHNCVAYNGSKFMMVNGYNILTPTEVVWRETVNVSQGIVYTFKCRVLNIGVSTIYGNPQAAHLVLMINGEQIDEKTVGFDSNYQWQLWTVDWTSTGSTAIIEIFDTYHDNYNGGLGDDFGLDAISFKMHNDYYLTANNFTVSYCGEITPIDLSGHYTIYYPFNGNSAPPMEVKIRKGNYDGWQTHINLDHGTATVGSDNRITYTPNTNFYGQDSFQYKISRFGLESYATITVNIGDFPSNCTPQGLPDKLCINDVSSFNPSATWEPIGTNIVSGWQYKKVDVTDWQESYTFQNWVPQWGGIGEYSIQFFAQNSCTGNDYVYSEPYNFTICDVPEITGTNVTSICTGSAEPRPDVEPNYNTVHPTWQYKRNNGNWIDFTWGQFDLQPGDQIRYRVTWDYCGGSPWISSNIDVVSGPEFNASIPVSFNEGYCPGVSEELPQIQSSWYDSHDMVVESGWYYVIENSSGSPDYDGPIEGNTITLPNDGSVLVTPCLYNDDCGFTPYYPAFNLVVWEAPTIQGLENLPDSLGPVCSGTTLSSILPALSPGGHFLDNGYGWEISSGQSQTGFSSNLPTQLSVGDNGRWLRYHVQKDCTAHNDIFSNPIRVWVGAAPTLSTSQIEPFGTVCAGTSLASLLASLDVDVYVTNWNHFHDEESFERWEVLLNGSWMEFTQFELSYNGCQVRYRAHNQCGDAIVSAGTVTVAEGPSFTHPNEQLDFEEQYCVTDLLMLPAPPDYDDHDVNITDEYWASSFDGIEYSPIAVNNPVLTESWHERYVSYVLVSECGGEIVYPTPFQLYVVGTPDILSVSVEPTTLCVGETCYLAEAVVDWHHGNDTLASTWQYSTPSNPNTWIDFDPLTNPLPVGINYVVFRANNGCYMHPISEFIEITVNATPSFENPEQPFELGRFCEDELLVLPSTPSVMGHIEDSLWRISIGTDPDGSYEPIAPNYLNYHLTLDDNHRWLQYYAIGCNTPIHYELEIHVDGKPWEECSIADSICKGQHLSYQWINPNGYPITDRELRIGSTTGETFDPDEYTFDVEGEYLIYYRVGNDCGWSDYQGPLHLSVTAGPEFDNSTLPNGTQYVCEGTTVGEFLEQSGIAEPSLLDPSVPHDPLGWFINGQPVELSTVILEGFHDSGLCYGVSGDCSDVPVYSNGILLHVYGRPEVAQMPSIDWEFCDGDPVQLSDPEIDFHYGEDHVQGYWQIQSPDGSWGNLPTTWGADHNGMQIRYHLEHTVCSDLDNNSGEMTVSVNSAPIINDADLPTENLITICFGSPLGISEPDVQPVQNVSGWQVSANGTDWSTQLDGHTFNPAYVDNYFNGKYLRYHAESTRCPGLEDNSMVYTIQLIDSPTINDTHWPNLVQYCSGGSLGIDVPSGLPGEWQVSTNGTNWDTELEGHVFDENHIDDYFDGKFVRYYVHSSCGDAESKVLTLRLMAAINMPINGETQVAMMNSFWPGIYDYHIDSADLVQPVEWSLQGADWPLQPMGMARCLVYVNSIGAAVLHARVANELCSNEFEVLLPINATHFGVEDNHAMEVTVYPNPTRNTVTIEAEGIESVRLMNMMGQMLEMREYGGQDSVTINLNGYTPSVYLLEVKTVNGVAKKRLILYR